MKKYVLLILLLCTLFEIKAQNIGINNPTPAASALLDLTSVDKGLLVPRVALQSIILNAPIGAGIATSLLVYNTATSGGSPYEVTPGYYYWNGTRWVRLLTGGGTAGEGWQTSGNAGLIDGTHFLGTKDNVPLNLKVNNQRAGRIDNFRRNVTWGYVAGNSLINGFDNVFVGDSTGYNNTNGFHNIFIGKSAGFSNNDGQDNIFMGYRAGYNNNGDYNMFYGVLAGLSNTSGTRNAFFGINAGMGNVDGSYNSFFGASAGINNTSGNYNSFYGSNAGYNNTSGNQNTFIGKVAGRLNNTGYSNTFIGDSAGYTNAGGGFNTAVGAKSNVNTGYLINATAIGAYARVDMGNSLVLGSVAGINGATSTVYVGIGTTSPQDRLHVVGNIRMVDGNQASGRIMRSDANGTGYWQTLNASEINAWGLSGNAGTVDNVNYLGTSDGTPLNFRVNNQKAGRISMTGHVLLGYEAGNSNPTLSSTAIGFQALYSNTAGINTAIGYNALYTCTGGGNNTAVGYRALYFLTSGSNNTAMGHQVLSANVTGHTNTAYGAYALSGNIGGYRNTAVGYNAGNAGTPLQYGNYNTLVGYYAAADNASRDNCIALAGNGNLAFGGDNRVRIGNSSVTSIGGQVGWTTLSDARVKTNVKEDIKGLEFIMKLKPVSYQYQIGKSNMVQHITDTAEWDGKYDIERVRFSGFLAQDVEKAAAECNYPFSGVDKPEDPNGLWGIRYAEFTVPLVKSVQELNQKNESLNNDIKELNQTINNLLMEVKLLHARNKSMEDRMIIMEKAIERD